MMSDFSAIRDDRWVGEEVEQIRLVSCSLEIPLTMFFLTIYLINDTLFDDELRKK
jgi:hypothetical protein